MLCKKLLCRVVGLLLTLALLLGTTPAAASGAVQLLGIAGPPLPQGSYPADMVADARGVFFAADGANGRELWRRDALSGYVTLVADINPGPGSSSPRGLIFLNGLLLFFADDGEHGRELWRSDGTPEGTVLVADVNPGPRSSGPTQLAAVRADGRIFFQAADGKSGAELWQSDGTVPGTAVREELSPGPASSSPASFVRAASGVFFTAYTPESGRQLWLLPQALINYAPQVRSATLSTPIDTPLNGQVGASDHDSEPLRFRLVSSPTRGSITLDVATGNFRYTPRSNIGGVDRFVVAVSDGHEEQEATIELRVGTQARYLPLVRGE